MARFFWCAFGVALGFGVGQAIANQDQLTAFVTNLLGGQ